MVVDLFIVVDFDEIVVVIFLVVVSILIVVNNIFNDLFIVGVSWNDDGGLDLCLNVGFFDLSGNLVGDDVFFQQVIYRGVFGNSDFWLEGWIVFDVYGYFGNLVILVD